MDSIFMNSEKSKISYTHRLLLSLPEKNKLKTKWQYVALSNLSIWYTWKGINGHTKTIDLKYQPQRGMEKFNYLMDHVMYQIFKIILGILSKSIKNDWHFFQEEYA